MLIAFNNFTVDKNYVPGLGQLVRDSVSGDEYYGNSYDPITKLTPTPPIADFLPLPQTLWIFPNNGVPGDEVPLLKNNTHTFQLSWYPQWPKLTVSIFIHTVAGAPLSPSNATIELSLDYYNINEVCAPLLFETINIPCAAANEVLYYTATTKIINAELNKNFLAVKVYRQQGDVYPRSLQLQGIQLNAA